MVDFNIGSQTAGVVNNVAGDQFIAGNQTGVTISVADARAAAHALRVALDQVDLPGMSRQQREDLASEADAISAELAATNDPPRESIRARLTRITAVLRDAGALAGAAATLIAPITALANWLGPMGASILGMLL